MIDMHGIFLIALFAPAIAALVCLLVPAKEAGGCRHLATFATLVSLVAILALFAGFQQHGGTGFVYRLQASWIPEIGASFDVGLDSTSMVLLLLAGLVNFCGVLVGGPAKREKEYLIFYLLLASGAMLAVTALDLLLFYVALEVDVLCAFLMIACWGDLKDGAQGRTPVKAAITLTLFLAAGAVLVSLGFWALYHLGGHTFSLPAMQAFLAENPLAPDTQHWVFLVLFAGFGVLLSVWPMHIWAPLGYAAAPTSMSMISAGVLKTLGAYGLMRVAIPLLPEGAQAWSGTMATLALVNILYGAWMTLRQTDWKLLIGYSAVSHMGYVLLGLAALNTAGTTGALMLLFAHGLATAAAFALIGAVEARTGTRALAGMSGLARTLPFAGPAMVLTAFAICGLPGFASFWGEIMVMVGAWQHGTLPFRAAVVVAVTGLVLTATYMLAAIRASFFGPVRADADTSPEVASAGFKLACVILIGASMLVGFAPRILTDLVPGEGRVTRAQSAGVAELRPPEAAPEAGAK